jgi:hypothetical protein
MDAPPIETNARRSEATVFFRELHLRLSQKNMEERREAGFVLPAREEFLKMIEPRNDLLEYLLPTLDEIYERLQPGQTVTAIRLVGLSENEPAKLSEPLKEWPEVVLPAVDSLVERGIADPERLGIMGHDRGAYGVNCIVTQTARFKAAVSIGGDSDLVGKYFALSGQGISTGMDANEAVSDLQKTIWGDRRPYLDHSPLFHLDRAETPLLLMHGEKGVYPPVVQSQEMFTGLRRLGKTVSLAIYPDEGSPDIGQWEHENMVDAWGRILEWFGRYL